mmetsp:Transcript_25767/g.65510  ORF Transcript_25767/g.65510 Transcript_25767/m.65510 type:complete len:206 (+) Transcript_25767:555-1172(+)
MRLTTSRARPPYPFSYTRGRLSRTHRGSPQVAPGLQPSLRMPLTIRPRPSAIRSNSSRGSRMQARRRRNCTSTPRAATAMAAALLAPPRSSQARRSATGRSAVQHSHARWDLHRPSSTGTDTTINLRESIPYTAPPLDLAIKALLLVGQPSSRACVGCGSCAAWMPDRSRSSLWLCTVHRVRLLARRRRQLLYQLYVIPLRQIRA